MRSWIRLGLIVTALWVVGSFVAVVYLGSAPSWRVISDAAFADWHRQKVETETGRPLADWDLQVRVTRESCLAAMARKSIAPDRQAELCDVSPLYAEPTALERVWIILHAVADEIAGWLHEFLIPIAVWSIFVPFCIWFIGIATALFVVRLRGDRPHSAERPNRIIH